jgi:hypothetical protein
VTADFYQITNSDPEQRLFLEGVKDYARSQLKDWPKSEFKLNQFFEHFGNIGYVYQ